MIYRAYKKSLIQELELDQDRWYSTPERLFRTRVSWEPMLSARAAIRKLKIGEIPGDEPPRIGGERKLQDLALGRRLLLPVSERLPFLAVTPWLPNEPRIPVPKAPQHPRPCRGPVQAAAAFCPLRTLVGIGRRPGADGNPRLFARPLRVARRRAVARRGADCQSRQHAHPGRDVGQERTRFFSHCLAPAHPAVDQGGTGADRFQPPLPGAADRIGDRRHAVVGREAVSRQRAAGLARPLRFQSHGDLVGDSMRGYGLGTLAMLFLFGAFWRMVESPTRGCIGLALLAAVFAVQAMYFNAVLLFAMGAGGAAVAVWRRDWKLLGLIAGIGIAAAVSLLPYSDPLSRQYRWNAVVKSPVEMAHLYHVFSQAITVSGAFLYWIWMALPLIVLFACGWHWKRTRAIEGVPRKALVAYLPLLMIVGPLCYLYLLVRSELPTQVWYYVGIMAFLAAVFDVGVDLLVAGHWIGRCVRMATAATVVAIVYPTIWPQMQVRLTNVDLVAQKLESVAAPDDLIVVARWWPGVTFQRYYHGRASWTSIPELSDMSIQRFDLLKERMAEKEPIRPLLEKMVKTLATGHRLWIVGRLPPLRPNENPAGSHRCPRTHPTRRTAGGKNPT